MIKFTSFIVIFTILTTYSTYSQEQHSEDRELCVSETFIFNDMVCHRIEGGGVALTISAEKVRQFGSYVRLKIEVVNFRNERVTFMTDSISATITYDGIPYKVDVCTYSDFMRIVRRRSILWNTYNKYKDNTLSYYNIEDGSSYGSRSYRTLSRYKPIDKAKNIFGEDFNFQDSTFVDYQEGNSISNNDIEQSYRSGNINQYRMLIERNYLRSNTLVKGRATGGFVLIKKRSGNLIKVEIRFGGKIFNFEWDLKKLESGRYT